MKNEPFWYYLTNLFGEAPSFRATVRGTAGQSRDVTVETLNHFDYQQWREKNPVFEPNREGIEVEFLDSGATAHFLYPSFRAGKEERKKIDGAFQELSAKGSRNLIVDLRGNGGGESSMAAYLARYLYSGKFRPISKIKFNVSRDAVSHLPLWARALIIWNGKSHSIAEGREQAEDVLCWPDLCLDRQWQLFDGDGIRGDGARVPHGHAGRI